MILKETTRHTDIRNIVLTEPKHQPYVFDPESVITPSSFARYKTFLRESLDDDQSTFLQTAAELAIIFPEIRDELGLPPSAEFFLERLEDPASVKILYPYEATPDFVDNWPSYTFEKLKSQLQEGFNPTPTWNCFVLYPRRMNEIREIPKLKERIATGVEVAREHTNWKSYLELASSLKFLDPAYKNNLSRAEWKEIEDVLRSEERFTRGPRHPAQTYYTARAKIVASERVEMTQSRGMILTMPKASEPLHEAAKMPVRRSF